VKVFSRDKGQHRR